MEGLCLPFSSSLKVCHPEFFAVWAELFGFTRASHEGHSDRSRCQGPRSRPPACRGHDGSRVLEVYRSPCSSRVPGSGREARLKTSGPRNAGPSHSCSSIAKPTTARVRTTTVAGVETRPQVEWAGPSLVPAGPSARATCSTGASSPRKIRREVQAVQAGSVDASFAAPDMVAPGLVVTVPRGSDSDPLGEARRVGASVPRG